MMCVVPCAGWAVRDVVAHLAATAVLSRAGFVREFIRAGFSTERIVQRQVSAARRRDASESLTALHSAVNCTVSPPLPTITRIIEIVVHGLSHRKKRSARSSRASHSSWRTRDRCAFATLVAPVWGGSWTVIGSRFGRRVIRAGEPFLLGVHSGCGGASAVVERAEAIRDVVAADLHLRFGRSSELGACEREDPETVTLEDLQR
jgi:hypothetical protein